MVIVRVLPEMSTRTAEAFQLPGAACHGILSVARYIPSVAVPEIRCACERNAVACCWPPGPVNTIRLSGAVPPIDGLRSSVIRAVTVTTAGPPEVSTVVGVTVSDRRTGRVRVDRGDARAIAPSETNAKRRAEVAVAATTDRRRRAEPARRGGARRASRARSAGFRPV